MKVFVLDVLHDLRTKRLWPVAAGLLVAIVAVPAILLGVLAPKPVPAAPVPSAAPTAAGVLSKDVKVSSQPEAGSSDLDTFESHNPFRPKGGPQKEEQPEGEPSPPPATDASDGSTTPPAGGDSEATPPGKSPAGGGDGSSKTTKKSDDSSSSSSGDNDSSKSDNHSGNGGSGNNSGSSSSDVRLLSYNAETAYGPAGRVNKHTVEPNDVFPSGRRYFMYSGVSKDGRDAIFTVLDPGLVSERSGDGHCVQVSGRCAVLHLRDGQERRFKDVKGNTFVIRLGSLDPVKKLVEDLSGKLRDTVGKLLDPLDP